MYLSQTNWSSESKYNKTQYNQVRHMTRETEHEHHQHNLFCHAHHHSWRRIVFNGLQGCATNCIGVLGIHEDNQLRMFLSRQQSEGQVTCYGMGQNTFRLTRNELEPKMVQVNQNITKLNATKSDTGLKRETAKASLHSRLYFLLVALS